MQKFFIITVDTEGDNLWDYIAGEEVQTENAKYLEPFQKICEAHHFKPVYLANYEMLTSSSFVEFAKKHIDDDTCEVGLHLHAWNNPPHYELERKYKGNPYLIEYPKDVMRAKFEVLYKLYEDVFNQKPVSHRAGRWAMNQDYFDILEDYNIKVDCSYTPGKSWRPDCGQTIVNGPDYSDQKLEVSMIGNILEVPMTLSKFRFVPTGSWKHKTRVLFCGGEVWLRTSMSKVHDIKKLVNRLDKTKGLNYLEFMIHSSELMPGGSPYFKTAEAVAQHLSSIEEVFCFIEEKDYKGVTLAEYNEIIRSTI